MPFLSRFCLVAASVFLFSTAAAEECRAVRPFETGPASKKSRITVRIPDFEGPRDVASVSALLFREYLGLAKGIAVSPSGGGRPVLGRVVKDGEGYHLALTSEAWAWEGRFLYPEQLNAALVDAVDRLSREIGSPLPPKKLLPFVNTTTSPKAYGLYAQAWQSLSGDLWTDAPLKKAQEALEKSIQADYNYVPGYLSLAEVLAARYRLTGEDGWKRRALVELQKARLLLPPLTELREPKVLWTLEAKAKDVCGGGS